MRNVFLAGLFLVFVAFCSDASGQTRIRFARGRTSATISGSLGGNAGKSFVLGAKNGQSLSGNVSSKGDCVKFSEGATSISFITKTGDNLIRLVSRCGRLTSFTMTVSINFGTD